MNSLNQELQRRLSLALQALTWFYDDHVIEGDPPCPCKGCERARAAFAAQLRPLPDDRDGDQPPLDSRPRDARRAT